MTVVLIHGGGATGGFWDRLLPYLDHDAWPSTCPGRRARPADLATLTVEPEVASVVADIAAAAPAIRHAGGPFLRGLVVPGVVAAMGDRVGAVVSTPPWSPTRRGTGSTACCSGTVTASSVGGRSRAATVGPSPCPAPPANPEAFRPVYGGDPLDDDTLAYVVDPACCVPDTVHHYFQPVFWSAVVGVPITYVLNVQDRPVRPDDAGGHGAAAAACRSRSSASTRATCSR